MNIEIRHGNLIDPGTGLNSRETLFVSQGRIAAIGNCPEGFRADEVIDASGQMVIPGLIDMCARMREPGQEHKATIHSETAAAVAGGVTSICCPPDTDPVIDTPAVAEQIIHRAKQAGKAHLYPVAAATAGLVGDSLSELDALRKVGCVAASNGLSDISQSEVLRRVMEYCYSLDTCLMMFCEDQSLRNHGTAHEGIMSLKLGLPGIPSTAETIAISRALLLAEQTGVQLHISHISSARSVELIANAKQKGINISADVSIHHLLLNENELQNFNACCHLRPPLRSAADQQALIDGVRSGIVDCLCSDHQPHDIDAKAAPFSLTEPGISSIEYLLPLVMMVADEYQINTEQLLKTVTINPAEILGLTAGSLAIDEPADICVFNPQASLSIDTNNMLSAGKNCAYHGWEVSNLVTHTLVAGSVVYRKT